MNEVWKCDLIIIKFGEFWDQEWPFRDTHLIGVLHMNAGEERINPLIPYSDQHQISPYNINAFSTPEVLRIKDMIT